MEDNQGHMVTNERKYVYQGGENLDARVSDCWTEQGWDISLKRLLNDWEVEEWQHYWEN
ncbi:hypothetical protein H5410_061072 [Solanum commersonii]|uniref:Uncharacterized protein n=1 Tax=Solanum commersonii TaxID=4109 RepID=A0A9J5W6Z6_SOLCO|nr:hypothetical protein H5410_061072 [Solanum commersonii]